MFIHCQQLKMHKKEEMGYNLIQIKSICFLRTINSYFTSGQLIDLCSTSMHETCLAEYSRLPLHMRSLIHDLDGELIHFISSAVSFYLSQTEQCKLLCMVT